MSKIPGSLLLVSAGFVAVALAHSGAFPETGMRSEPLDVILTNGQRVSGTMAVRSLTVPENAVIYLENDLHVSAASWLVIHGSLVALDRASSAKDSSPGYTIDLAAQERIEVLGRVVGGRGLDYGEHPGLETIGHDGGRGSDISLQSPLILVDGQVVAGDGGRGGAGAKGGAGGDLLC